MENWITNLKNKIITYLTTSSNKRYDFSIPETQEETSKLSSFDYTMPEKPYDSDNTTNPKTIFPSLEKNLEFMKISYNALINSDIVIREFTLHANNRTFKAFLFYIDGMSDTKLINDFVLKPLMLKNIANSFNYRTKELKFRFIILSR